MGLMNIIDDIIYLLIWYYINNTNCIPNIYTSEKYKTLHDEVMKNDHMCDNEIFLIVKKRVLFEFTKRFDINSELSAVVFFPNRLFYKFDYTDNMNEMKDNITTYTREQITTIYNATDTVLSLNTVPFDGLDITHSFILNLINFYIH